MPRSPRIVVGGMPHHVRQRGNRKCITFCDDVDRRTYIRVIHDQCVKLAVRIWAYALMRNHVHLIAVPESAESLSLVVQAAHGAYAEYFNVRHGTVGHLWEGRFKSSVLDEAYLRNAVRYVERNPVRAGIVRRAEEYQWSSAAAHCGLRDDPLLSNDLVMLDQIPDWSAWLRNELPDEEMTFLRERTRTGRPAGDDAFIKKVSEQIGRDISRKVPGPKPTESVKLAVGTSLFDEFGN